ncbi:GPW/gp25 family protein [Qipengyuania citrea]|uniref:GPW/gp25 family protein n=1 Tax=Qipengyuania citrea TaxID=225971 RepID=UPI00209E78EF|nr:GPW/gp25 family protein [Qipengyuania citrea]MCP2016848.1 phage baseplate assembly protein W [Qipengyuania citrea]
MIGISATTGKRLEGEAHLAQSIGDILSTPLGSRVMRRDYGSLLFELIDKPVNGAARMLMHAATAIALRRWEPRLRLTRVSLQGDAAAGQLTIRIEGQRLDLPPANSLTTLTIPIDTTRGQRAQAAN